MFISNPADLARALRPLLKDQVVIRYAIQHRGSLHFAAQLAVLSRLDKRDYLAHASIGVSISHHTKDIDIDSRLSITDLKDNPSAIEQMCAQWSERPFDDWMHSEPFMGAYGIFLEGQPHTSVKWDAMKVHWRFLTGVVVAELGELKPFKTTLTDFDAESIVVMRTRFEAFAAKTELAWATRELI